MKQIVPRRRFKAFHLRIVIGMLMLALGATPVSSAWAEDELLVADQKGQQKALTQAPPRNVETCLDVLGCDRIDHGYNILADPALTCRCREQGVPFTVCSHTCVSQRMEKRAASLKAMHDAGLFLVPCTDDPPMFGTDIGTTYVTMARILSLGAEEVMSMSLRAIEASWLSAEEKASMTADFQGEIQFLAEMDA
ncbi:amidohydrolase family protein [Acetobacter senegalensis]|uniref:hypothetical protein n=1 Tax=Acetobacter senegalensis TaxID=446692 RepID=UPI0026523407|nr:hypothetical protein [Acetobacter senegalensis]MDN7354916.1 hypothetical protein [Acetobacter senegalensis]